ncbi:MAG: DMT family transporter [Spirochaetaceae bacterium]|nr:MAG: DMT family transporter [Spirochaetaceae bacterium]
MLLSVLGLAMMQSLARYLGNSVSSWTKTFYRSLFTVVIILAWMLVRKEKLRFNNRPLLLLRAVAGAFAISFFFWTIDLIGLLTATLYLYVYPVFAILFAVLLFKERFSPWILLPLAAALAGLYLIVNPDFEDFSLGHGVGLATALLSGISRAALRQLRKTDSPSNIVILFMGFAVVLSGIGVLVIPGQSWLFVPSRELNIRTIWILLVAIALFSAFSHIMVTVAYGRLSTATASIMTMLNLPITAVMAVLYFHEPLTVYKIVGGLLITAAGIGVSFIPSRGNL